jgi:hypothetical protein
MARPDRMAKVHARARILAQTRAVRARRIDQRRKLSRDATHNLTPSSTTTSANESTVMHDVDVPTLGQRVAARILQRAFRAYMRRRYIGIIDNVEDTDHLSLEYIWSIPRALLFVMVEANGARHGYHAAMLLQWLVKWRVHPVCKRVLTLDECDQCYELVYHFVDQYKTQMAPTDLDTYEKSLRRYRTQREADDWNTSAFPFFEGCENERDNDWYYDDGTVAEIDRARARVQQGLAVESDSSGSDSDYDDVVGESPLDRTLLQHVALLDSMPVVSSTHESAFMHVFLERLEHLTELPELQSMHEYMCTCALCRVDMSSTARNSNSNSSTERRRTASEIRALVDSMRSDIAAWLGHTSRTRVR